MTAAMWPSNPPAWTLPWLIWRFRGGVPPRPDVVPKEIPTWAWGVAKWMGWRRKGAIPPRPVSTEKAPIPPKIPQWAWGLLKQLNIAVPLKPPPPPPPPPNPVPLNSWKLRNPLVFTSWGWLTNSDFRNVEVIGSRMGEAGVGTVALQIGMFPGDVPDRLRAFGFDIALWGEPGSQDAQALSDSRADGYIPQIEGIYQYANAIRYLREGVGAGLSLSTVTTLAGLETYTTRPNGTQDGEQTTEEVEALIEAGLTHAWVECYTGDMSPLDVSDFIWAAKRRGIYYANPVMGLAGRAGVSINETYKPDVTLYGRQVSSYLAEPMRPLDWAELKAL